MKNRFYKKFNKTNFFFVAPFLAAAFLFFGGVGTASAATNILSDAGKHWAWNDVIGWIDYYNTLNVNVLTHNLTGYASSSVGYIALDCATSPVPDCGSSYQIKNNGNGNLKGWAWNDQIGWISFCGGSGGSDPDCPGATGYSVNIDSNTGKFTGWAWNDVVGWISFCNSGSDCSGSPYAYDVETDWRATSTSGWLESTTYDTGAEGGAAINSVMWIGYQPAGTVTFQFAASNNSSGPWSYATSTSYTISGCPSVASCAPTPLDYTLNNNRYFRYRMQLISDQAQAQTPRVDDVIINWSP